MVIFVWNGLKTKGRTAQVPAWQGSLGSPSQIQSAHYSGQRAMPIRAAQKQKLAVSRLANPVRPVARQDGRRAITQAVASIYRGRADMHSSQAVLEELQLLHQPLQDATFPQGMAGHFHQLEICLRPVPGQFASSDRWADQIVPPLHDDSRQVANSVQLLQ
jgi:hypothetical protein